MDKLVTAIQTADPKNDGDLKKLRVTLRKSEELLFKNLQHLDDVLATLDPKIHSLAFISILYGFLSLSLLSLSLLSLPLSLFFADKSLY